MNPDTLKYIDGVPFLDYFPEDNVRTAMNYYPRDNDVIIVTYPKCGTTWTQYIVSSILTKANPPNDPGEFMLYTPLIEFLGAEAAMSPARKGPLITHLPFKNIVFSKRAKYIYVARNPYDCCVSCYYFLKAVTPKSYHDVTFESFVEKFLSAQLFYGDYFDHLLDWYGLRNEKNVLFLTYEQLKEDTELWILKIADFLGKDHGSALKEDKKLLEKVLELSSVTNMKTVFNYNPHDRIKSLVELPAEKTLKSLDAFRNAPGTKEQMHEGAGFVRKGVVGDWKNHFTPDLLAKTKEWISNKAKGSDVMDLWNSCGLP
ncbi:hypothetical protein V5799_011740 [Amblyomma americanum]|uniref:Sulfotransferase domain-containing protein n=1 Tax=Amblyomma americanum TaxID=6943 RepID=A0AAQ4EG18_AMBAM